MDDAAILPRIGNLAGLAMHRVLRTIGLGRRARRQRVTYVQLMKLSDRQLEDIGLTRGLIETVVMQGPASVRALQPDGAVQPANINPRRNIA